MGSILFITLEGDIEDFDTIETAVAASKPYPRTELVNPDIRKKWVTHFNPYSPPPTPIPIHCSCLTNYYMGNQINDQSPDRYYPVLLNWWVKWYIHRYVHVINLIENFDFILFLYFCLTLLISILKQQTAGYLSYIYWIN